VWPQRLCHGAHVLPSASGTAIGAHVLPWGLMFCHQGSCSAIVGLVGGMYCCNYTTFSGLGFRVSGSAFKCWILFFIFFNFFLTKIHFGSEKKKKKTLWKKIWAINREVASNLVGSLDSQPLM
jgi:hypothetical protein